MIDAFEYVLDKFGISLLGLKHDPIEIPNFGRNELAHLFKEMGYTVGAEIGVQVGRYSEMLCRANPDLFLFCVDPWQPDAYKYSKYGSPYLIDEFERNYQAALKRLAPYNCKIVRKTSMEAVQKFEDEALDFVYIDGNHDFQNCTNDICEWGRKVRSGGIVAGHDYRKYKMETEIHVHQVVNSYTYAYRIWPWYILGDKVKSWFWVKE